ncbi:hypothetical protein Ddye_017426 [Dipteronia dyeriana]|uniref:Peptidylprolyl isomerase n=1 Tax=Dipteronia dyeriana TaxID=168575 RepID=A0AAD9X164_9ROSI|nr:hypothetical protein Ddye_017426 [Dipteronia dyeriana]
MGIMPEGFREKKTMCEDNVLARYFEDKSPMIELLEATFKGLMATEADDVLDMGYVLMVSQFFVIDEARTAIPGSLLSLVKNDNGFKAPFGGRLVFRKKARKKNKLGESANESDKEDHEEAMEEGATSLMKSKSRNSDKPSSRKWLFHGHDCETPKNLERFKKNWSLEIQAMGKSTSEKERVSQDKVMDDMNTHRHEKSEDKFEKEKVVSEASLEKVVGSSVVFEKTDVDTAGLEKVEPLFENVVYEGCLKHVVGSPIVTEKVDGDTTVEEKVETSSEKVVVQRLINVDEYPSLAVNVVLPNPTLSVIFTDAPDPNKRGRKRSWFIGSPHTDPIPKKKKKSQDSSENVNDEYIRFMSYLKKKDQTCVYTGQAGEMTHEDFNELVKPTKWLSNMTATSMFFGRGVPKEMLTTVMISVITNPRVFFDLTIGDHPGGRNMIELFVDSTLIITENFRALCAEEKGISTAEWLYRKQVIFGQVVEGFDMLKAVDKIGSISSLTSKVVMVIDCRVLC